MSKSTISERAVEYMADAMDKHEPTTDQEQNQTLRHLAQFASREVARVRRGQRGSLRLLEAIRADMPDGRAKAEAAGALCDVDAATRPERAVRAKVHKCKAGPTCHVCQGIAAKAMRDEAKKGAR